MTAFNVTAFPEIFGELLGLDVEPMGILITVVGICLISLVLATLELDITGIAITNVAFICFTTYLNWFPIWITIIIALIVSVLTARKAVTVLQGGGI